ncbi:MAG: hypothetical protein ACRDRO_21525 [Pseudonocardiaceae bacterium]
MPEQPLVTVAVAHPDHAAAVSAHLTALAGGIGPECDPNVRAAVLAAAGGDLTVGQVIQYLEVKSYQLILCTVTVQPGEQRP